MKYMNFNSSCSYCCLANLLEEKGINAEDREIALEMGLPYLLFYDLDTGTYQAGAMLQGKYWFDRYLNSLGFTFAEEFVPKISVPDFVSGYLPCMMGLKTGYRKHAMICTGKENGKYRFLNPHRLDDGQPDELLFGESELMEALSEVNAVGRIEPSESMAVMDKTDYQNSLKCLRQYKAALYSFCREKRSTEEIMAAMNTLLRPFAVDGLAMMELAGEDELAEELRLFQNDCMTLFRSGDCRPDEVVDMNRLDRIVNAYKSLITKKLDF